MVKTLNRYLEVTEERREGKAQFLLSFKKAYREIVSGTVSVWFKTVLELGNINREVFKRHSTKSVFTSKVSLKGLSLSDILDRGSWSNKFIWQKSYNKQMFHLRKSFKMTYSKTSFINALNEDGGA